MLCCVPQYFPPLKETPPQLLQIFQCWKYASERGGSLTVFWFEEQRPRKPLPPLSWLSHSCFPASSSERLHCCPGKSVPFPPPCPPEHCPRHPLPAHLSGAGNFTKRDFTLLGQGGGTSPGAPCVSLLCWLKHFVQVDQIYVPKSHLPLDQWSLPPTFEGGGRRGGCMRLMRTPGFHSGEKSKRNLSTPSLSSRDLPPSPLFTQTATIPHPLQRNPSLQATGRRLWLGFCKADPRQQSFLMGNKQLTGVVNYSHIQTHTHTLLSTLEDLILPTLLLPQIVFTKASQ